MQQKIYTPGLSIAEVAELFGLNPKAIIKLGSNENPLGPSSLAIAALQNYNAAGINIYPATYSDSLCAALSQRFPQVGTAKVVAGNGMDAILEALARMLLRPGDKVLIHTPTFEYYELVAKWAGAEPVFVQTHAADNFALNLEEFVANIHRHRPKLIFVCTPNNPTGNLLDATAIASILEAAQLAEGYVFLDEAYAEYAGQNYLHLVAENPHLIIGRTFSKLYGLAGLRVGWAVIPAAMYPTYNAYQTPFNVNSLSMAGLWRHSQMTSTSYVL